MRMTARAAIALTWLSLLVPARTSGQGRAEDYARSESLSERVRGLVVDVMESPTWIGETNRFWYRKTVTGGAVFELVDPATREKRPAFDHARLASALGAALDTTFTAVTLPFEEFEFVEGEQSLEVEVRDTVWRCTLTTYACMSRGPAPAGGRGGRGGRGGFGGQNQQEPEPRVSPDSMLEAYIQNYNIAVRPAGSDDEPTLLSRDGSEGNHYELSSIAWSPDSRKIAAYRTRPGYGRVIHFIESAPTDQLQPKYFTRNYLKPGDVLDHERPVLFDVATRQQIHVDDALFPNPYSLSRIEWWDDGRGFTFEYNQRGHQVYRVIEVDATTGQARALISEEPETFFNYRTANGNRSDSGRKYRYDVDDGAEIVWLSERDGWSHLYLYDGRTGAVKRQITKGEWVVRNVERVDEENRQIWFRASGMNADQDPYFLHTYRIDFDGSNLVAYTEADGEHAVSWSPDRQYYVDTWSRVDLPTVGQLRRTSDRSVVMDLEQGDASALLATGWRYPEVFVSKARDGATDIWGVIVRPTNFDSAQQYPVIEYIYAGPQGSFVPKTFSTQNGMQSIAELGFIVVQVDGMGTNNRSKAFHDYAWQNLGDAGFPDRILWHKAIAAQYPYYDITRVGIYGTSAGGQNSMGALLFHPEFYDVAVSAAGCHDNRMDKIWWNEQWMGYPLGAHYDASSNVVNAHRLQGKLLLIWGELDTNVDPASTMQVVNALIKADKSFDMLYVPGMGHSSGGAYGAAKRNDYFVKHLLGVEPPDRNRLTADSN
jgi:dipeptidyl aminopeptidase/acylaminoacyl peptidase